MLLLQSTFGPAPNVPLPRAQILKQLNELGLKQWVDNNVVRQGEIRETRFQVLEGHFFAQSARARGRGKRFQEACVRREERVRIANTGDGAETPPVRTPSRTPSPVLRSSTLAPEVGADEGGNSWAASAARVERAATAMHWPAPPQPAKIRMARRCRRRQRRRRTTGEGGRRRRRHLLLLLLFLTVAHTCCSPLDNRRRIDASKMSIVIKTIIN